LMVWSTLCFLEGKLGCCSAVAHFFGLRKKKPNEMDQRCKKQTALDYNQKSQEPWSYRGLGIKSIEQSSKQIGYDSIRREDLHNGDSTFERSDQVPCTILVQNLNPPAPKSALSILRDSPSEAWCHNDLVRYFEVVSCSS
jgi:hypothetical protein